MNSTFLTFLLLTKPRGNKTNSSLQMKRDVDNGWGQWNVKRTGGVLNVCTEIRDEWQKGGGLGRYCFHDW